ncbi:hypothetical protein [Myceligenerans pegani]|uniref:Uncharacterized protein n=1 Tax=Myceligenerans pegani TaxID=2776917 RepID=A0ABR9MXJ5_9MICO|nr:hypothetical protein [Myceligenerans sp. TRM 65318]MBE1876119.1 hypothetical protein [Myceligenerans sp. TRM 65318]MBE3018390.1 hypothetical protein [Myceligenerans sp. TRM 65318]
MSTTENSRIEGRARREAADHLRFVRLTRTSRVSAHEVLWEAAAMAARRAAWSLPGALEEARVQARAFRLLNASWSRLMDRHDRARKARVAERALRAREADRGPATLSPAAAARPRATEHRAREGAAGMDGP